MAEFEIKDGILFRAYDIPGFETVMIPETVKIIGESAFENCKTLYQVVLPHTVTEVRAKAFLGCSRMKKIDFGNSLKRIGERAFEMCVSLTEIKLPDSVEVIKKFAFHYCIRVQKFRMSESIKKLGMYSLSDMLDLKKLSIPDTIEEWDILCFPLHKRLRRINITVDQKVMYYIPVSIEVNQYVQKREYDKAFIFFESEELKIRSAFLRLKSSYHLLEEDKKMYFEYLQSNRKKVMDFCIENHLVKEINFCGEIKLWNPQDILYAIDDIARKNDTEMKAFLMNYYHEHFDKSETFDLNLEEL